MVAAAIVWISLVVSAAFFVGLALGKRWERSDQTARDVSESLDALERIHIRSVPARW